MLRCCVFEKCGTLFDGFNGVMWLVIFWVCDFSGFEKIKIKMKMNMSLQ